MEAQILDDAIKKFNELEQLSCKILTTEPTIKEHTLDARILIKSSDKQWKYNVELKTQIVPAQIVELKNKMVELKPYILIAEYITGKAKQILRDNNIPYLDTAGNVFLKEKELHIFIETNKTNRAKLKTGNRAFTKSGSKVIYQFLLNPNYLNKPYRFIAKHAKVTIDTVRRVIQGLLRDQYIIQVNKKEYQFLDRTKLFQEWVTAFNKNLRPKLKQAKYSFVDKRFAWKDLDLSSESCWGGAIAAELVTDHLIADKGIIYTGLPFEQVMKRLKLFPNHNGKITLVEKFWRDESESHIANNILIYADLINEPTPRYAETAEIIYKNYVKNQL